MVSRSAAAIAASLLGAGTSCTGFAVQGGGDRLRRTRCGAFERGDGDHATGRRDLLDNMLGGFAALATSAALSAATTAPARALDFDAFESSVIAKDSSAAKPEMSDDEALCKFGAPGKAMGEACKRAGVKPNLPSVVDASGKVDRGDYLKCVYQYPVIEGQYVKTRVCKPSSEWGPP